MFSWYINHVLLLLLSLSLSTLSSSLPTQSSLIPRHQHAVSGRCFLLSDRLNTSQNRPVGTSLDILSNCSAVVSGIIKLNITECQKVMGRPFPLFDLLETLSAILQCQQNAPLHIAIRHAPEIQHTSLWPVLVHILECMCKWEKRVPVNIQSRGY